MNKFREVVDTGLTVRQVETAVQQRVEEKAEAATPTQPALFPDVVRTLSLKYLAKIKVKGTPQRGKIIFSYSSAKQLAAILARLNGVS